MKKLVLSYELAWRTANDRKFMKSKEWKEIRIRIFQRDNSTCQYCGIQRNEHMQINHMDGNPKNHADNNLEVICSSCHKILHSGLWAEVFKILDVYEESRYEQNEIIRITGKMRNEGKSDEEIIEFLGLKNKIPWKQDQKYLSTKYGFISSKNTGWRSVARTMTEEQQRQALENRENW